MKTLTSPAVINAAELRARHYNAQVRSIRRIGDDLMVFSVRPDWGRLEFQAGQYATLAMGYWEPRVADAQVETIGPGRRSSLIQRAYSISCALVDSAGRLVRASASDDIEFFVVLVRHADRPPALSPRLFLLEPGDRLYLNPHAHGNYLLCGVRPDNDIVFVATGTGEAPHNAMLAELLAGGHRGRIVSVNCSRYQRDLVYLKAHHRLEKMFPQYRYLTLTTREAINLDPAAPGYVGKQYLQDYFQMGHFERDAGLTLDPAKAHVFLCGNPAMIGAPRHEPHQQPRLPDKLGMVQILQRRGFRPDAPDAPGNVHFERYW